MDKVMEEGGVQRRFSATPIVPTLSVPIIAPTLSAHPPAVKGGLLLCIELPSQTIFFSAQGKFPSARKKIKKNSAKKIFYKFSTRMDNPMDKSTRMDDPTRMDNHTSMENPTRKE